MKTAIETFSSMEYLSWAKWYTWKGNFYSWLSISHQEYVMAFLCPFYSTLRNIHYWNIVLYKKYLARMYYQYYVWKGQDQVEIWFRSTSLKYYVKKMLYLLIVFRMFLFSKSISVSCVFKRVHARFPVHNSLKKPATI